LFTFSDLRFGDEGTFRPAGGPGEERYMARSVRSEAEGSATGSIGSRIDTMASQDRMIAVGFTVAMWVVLLFTYFAVRPSVPSAAVSVALILSLLVLGIFNTASMVALIRSYSKDKEFIYREDILNLDRNRRQREVLRAERGR
jgi:hypothetical protein